jgi:hypothetical protein
VTARRRRRSRRRRRRERQGEHRRHRTTESAGHGVLIGRCPLRAASAAGRNACSARTAAARIGASSRLRGPRDRCWHRVRHPSACPAAGRSGLARHGRPAGLLERARAHQRAMVVQHYSLNGAAFIPVGDFLASVAEWMGLRHTEILSVVHGTAPESAARSAELDRLVAALRADPAAAEVLDSGGEADALLAGLSARWTTSSARPSGSPRTLPPMSPPPTWRRRELALGALRGLARPPSAGLPGGAANTQGARVPAGLGDRARSRVGRRQAVARLMAAAATSTVASSWKRFPEARPARSPAAAMPPA